MIDEDSSNGFEEVEQVERETIQPNLFLLQRILVGKRCRDGALCDITLSLFAYFLAHHSYILFICFYFLVDTSP